MLTKSQYEYLAGTLAEGLDYIDECNLDPNVAYMLRGYLARMAEITVDPVTMHYVLRAAGITDESSPEEDEEFEREHPLELANDYEG